jgi:poly(3-hydroxybutyrate) depolymerase
MRRPFRLLPLGFAALPGLFLLPGRWAAAGPPAAPAPAVLTAPEREAIRAEVGSLEAQLAALGARREPPARLEDAAVYLKAARWALEYEERLAPADGALLRAALRRGSERARAMAAGRAPWAVQRGRLVRGYRSAVDGSVQPYGVIVPASYDPAKPARLDVVLHGSTRPTGMSELRFMRPFEEEAAGGEPAAGANWIELRPLGRVENCYRWAGETDVFEAIADVSRCYRVDPDRIVLRGMSMGASGTWHLGLKHPDRFAALGPYCGYVDTHQFSLSPMPNFVKVGPLPAHQEASLHLLDSVDYAANAGMVPVVAAMGEKDPFFQAHVLMGEAMQREGLALLNLIAPGTAHVQDPATFAEQLRRIDPHAARGVDRQPAAIRFVTWSLKYPRCHWIELLGLEAHYRRAELRARREPGGTIRVEAPVNVTRFAIRRPAPGSDSTPPPFVRRASLGTANATRKDPVGHSSGHPSPPGDPDRQPGREPRARPRRAGLAPRGHPLPGCAPCEVYLIPRPGRDGDPALRGRADVTPGLDPRGAVRERSRNGSLGIAIGIRRGGATWTSVQRGATRKGGAAGQKAGGQLFVGGQEVTLPRGARAPVLGRRGGKWTYLGERDRVRLAGKRPGLQGPIDDAFAAPFLCVRGTGKPWNAAVGAWAAASLDRFAGEWRRYFRGDLPLKDDTAVTPADLRRCHLVLFGDPGSNRWIARALPGLPLHWTHDELRLGPATYPAADHAPALIAPNPLTGGAGRYLVLNSGHTFHEPELATLNYLLFPRLGDWAVMKVGGTGPTGPAGPPAEAPVQAGFFNEEWR